MAPRGRGSAVRRRCGSTSRRPHLVRPLVRRRSPHRNRAPSTRRSPDLAPPRRALPRRPEPAFAPECTSARQPGPRATDLGPGRSPTAGPAAGPRIRQPGTGDGEVRNTERPGPAWRARAVARRPGQGIQACQTSGWASIHFLAASSGGHVPVGDVVGDLVLVLVRPLEVLDERRRVAALCRATRSATILLRMYGG